MLNGQPVALRTGSGSITYLHRDQVNSVALTTVNGAVSQQRQYFPYGNKRGGADFAFEFNYTGQRLDDTGLLYYNARYYDPKLGQFISPDSIIPDPTDYFSYNRYLYGRGNPVSNNDPSGHCAINTDSSGSQSISKWDCTVGDFENLSWDDRKTWMNLFMQETGAEWFHNILGILDFFSADPYFRTIDGWASTADAGVLQAINDGWRIYEGMESIGPACGNCASTLWASFFTELGAPESFGTRVDILRRKWGIAEQAGVDYGVQVASPVLASTTDPYMVARANTFIELSNTYRTMIIDEAWNHPIYGWLVSVPLDSRTQTSRWFVSFSSHLVINTTITPPGAPFGP